MRLFRKQNRICVKGMGIAITLWQTPPIPIGNPNPPIVEKERS